jgi:ABC-type nitrate/sulfonate/bicarbonate transport system permease component
LRKKFVTIANSAVPLVFVGLLLVLWECLVRVMAVQEWLLPGPVRILETLCGNLPMLLKHAQSTLLECLAGFVIAILFSFILSFFMEEIPLLKRAFYPLLVASQTVPIISVAPLFIIWFGYGMLPKVIVVGLAAVDREYLELFRSMKAGRLATFRMVKLPLALPSFFSGLKISASYSVMGAVIGEWLGAKQGLGIYMTLAQRSFQVDRVFAAILVVTLCSAALFALVSLLERLIIPWNQKTKWREL